MAYAFIIEPGTYYSFEDETEQMEKCKEWGLLSEKAAKTKEFFYRGNGVNLICRIIGYVDPITAVIEFGNKQKHCIHPSYMKEMQASNFGQRYLAAAEESAGPEGDELSMPPEASPVQEAPVHKVKTEESRAAEPSKGKAKKERAQKIRIPEEKVKMTAKIKEFTTVPNHFSDNDDEVVIYEEVSIVEPETELGVAWSSYSATLKKLELEIGDAVTFEAKIVAKKLTRHPVPYKINNPAKIQKLDA